MSLRPARSADAPAITRVFQAAHEYSLGFLPNLHTDAEDHAFFAGLVVRDEVTVAEADGQVVAFLALSGDEVNHLYVHPDQHRKGLGTALLRHAQQVRDTARAVGLPAQYWRGRVL